MGGSFDSLFFKVLSKHQSPLREAVLAQNMLKGKKNTFFCGSKLDLINPLALIILMCPREIHTHTRARARSFGELFHDSFVT